MLQIIAMVTKEVGVEKSTATGWKRGIIPNGRAELAKLLRTINNTSC